MLHRRDTGGARHNAGSLSCPHCQKEIAHRDRNGGPGFILLSRYLRILPNTHQILVACPQCGQEMEFRAGHVVVEEQLGR